MITDLTLKKTQPIFYEDGHRYINKMGVEYKPVTSFIHNFIEEENWKLIADKFISKRTPQQIVQELHNKYNIPVKIIQEKFQRDGINSDTIQYFWNIEKVRACQEGNKYHQIQEGRDILMNNVIAPQQLADIPYNIANLDDGIYIELMLWSNNHLICGKADRITIETDKLTGIRYIDIEDYKTNKELKINYNYVNKNTKELEINKYMLYPVNHLVDCNWNHYRLQLSLYGYILEEYGYKVRSCRILHTSTYNEEDQKEYTFEYMKQEIIDMLSHRNK